MNYNSAFQTEQLKTFNQVYLLFRLILKQWIDEAKSTVLQIKEYCGKFIEKSETLLQDIQKMKPKVNDADPAQVSVRRSVGS